MSQPHEIGLILPCWLVKNQQIRDLQKAKRKPSVVQQRERDPSKDSFLCSSRHFFLFLLPNLQDQQTQASKDYTGAAPKL